MKNYRRILAVVLTVILSICLFALPVMAATQTANGLELTLVTDKAEYAEKEQRLCEQYNQKLEEMEPYLIQQLTGIYEHVFGVELSGHRNILQHLLAATLRSVEISEHYLIHVSEQDYPYVSMQKSQIVEEGCVKNASLEIAEDRTLGKNECLIETENGIFDCSLSTQLTELKRKLQLLSYTGMKE
jgi:flagellar assembly protein FliH